MIARFGYRRLLPLANILLFAILIGVGYVGTSTDASQQQGLEMAHSAQQEGWQPTYIERAPPLTHLLAWSLNFPAMLFATPFAFLAKGWRADLVVNLIAAVYLFVLWLVVGLWLDRRSDPRRRKRNTPALQTIRWSALVLSCAALVLVLALIVVRVMLHQKPEALCTIPMLFWPFFLAYAARWEIVHSRVPVDTPALVA